MTNCPRRGSREAAVALAALLALALGCTPGSLPADGAEAHDSGAIDRPVGHDAARQDAARQDVQSSADHPAGLDQLTGSDQATATDRATGVDHLTSGTLSPGVTTLNMNVAGQARSVRLEVPAEVSAGPRPLLIALHGNGDSAANFVATVGLSAACASRGVVLAAPEGISQSFTYMGQPLNDIDWDAYRGEAEGNIDLPLLDALRQDLVATGSIDAAQIYLFGYSQGGYLAFRGAMDDADLLAAAAVVAACNPLPGSSLISNAARTIPVALTIGEGDWAISGARQTRDELQAAGHEVRYEEIAGAGHVPFPGDAATLLDWLLARSL